MHLKYSIHIKRTHEKCLSNKLVFKPLAHLWLISGYHSTIVPGYHSTWVTWYLGTTVLGYHCTWIAAGTWIPQYLGSTVPLHDLRTWVPWYLGTMVPLGAAGTTGYHGTWIPQYLDSMVPLGTSVPGYVPWYHWVLRLPLGTIGSTVTMGSTGYHST